MDKNRAIKHVFPGGNTTKGFMSFYDNILSQAEANKILIIKGGPGVGKSYFMKKIGDKFLDLGYKLEYHHCSSDNNSLDAIVIVPLKVAILDGTAPHVVDPITPGAVDEILNLGNYWNEEGIKIHKEEIIKTNKEVGRIFNKAYNYLKAAYQIYEAWTNTEKLAFNKGKANLLSDKLIKELFEKYPVSNKPGKARHLFGTAITPAGLTEYLHTIIADSKKIYIIKDSPGASAKELMNKISDEALMRGLYIECYHSPIDVDKIEDIIIPKLDCAISVVNDYHKAKVIPTNIIDLTACLDDSIIKSLKEETIKDKILFEDLMQKAILIIQNAKRFHDKLESYYMPNMDFEKINELMETTSQKILEISKD